MLTVNVMLLNIVIAVLLEAFMVAAEEEKLRHSKEAMEEKAEISSGPLDPLLEKWLAGFSSNKDLELNMLNLWCVSPLAVCGAVMSCAGNCRCVCARGYALACQRSGALHS